MTPDELYRLVKQAVDGSIDFKFYALVGCLTFLFSALGSITGAYFKKRGENLATKADFDEILRQLERTTRASTEIKEEIESHYGEAAAIRHLVRDRLEAILMATFDLEEWCSQASSRAIEGEASNSDSSPLSKVQTLQTIYFPIAQAEMDDLKGAYINYLQWMLRVAQQSHESRERIRRQGGQLEIPELENMEEHYNPFLRGIIRLREALIRDGRPRGGLH